MATMKNIAGRRFGRLTALSPTDKRDSKGSVVWLCQCDCGNTCEVTHDKLTRGNTTSCGCIRREQGASIHEKLHNVDGTCIEWLGKRKTRRDNKTGVKGVFRLKNGHYRATIGFKGVRYVLGTFVTLDEAARVRGQAEAIIHGGCVKTWQMWQQRAAADPVWAKANPFHFEVQRTSGGFAVSASPSVDSG